MSGSVEVVTSELHVAAGRLRASAQRLQDGLSSVDLETSNLLSSGWKGEAATADFAARLEKAAGELQASAMWFMANGMKDPNNVGAGAVPFMHLVGVVAVGLMWLRMASAASRLKAAGEGDAAFLDAKLMTARFFAERVLPEAGALRRQIEGGADAIMALPVEMF